MNRKYLLNCCLIILIPVIQSTAAEYGSTDTDKNDTSGIDFETLSIFGVSPELAVELRNNILKAVQVLGQTEGINASNIASGESRQGNGGVSGGYYQQGGGGQGGGFGPGGQEEGDDDDDGATMAPGAGLFGWLSGLFGVASGLGMLNPTRVIQSTVNFFPPDRRQQVQMLVDSLTGYVPQENRTSRPLRPRTPPTRLPTELYSNNNLTYANTNGTSAKAPIPSGAVGGGKLQTYSIMRAPMPMPMNMNTAPPLPPQRQTVPTTTPDDDDEDEEARTTKMTTPIPMIPLAQTNPPPPPLPPQRQTVPTTTPEADDYDEEAKPMNMPVSTTVANSIPTVPATTPEDEDDEEAKPMTTAIPMTIIAQNPTSTVPTTTPEEDDYDEGVISLYGHFKPGSESNQTQTAPLKPKPALVKLNTTLMDLKSEDQKKGAAVA